MSILVTAQKYGVYKEITPGEYAGPCPKCGGALRFRIWPGKNKFACVGCSIEGGPAEICGVFGITEPKPQDVVVAPAKQTTTSSDLVHAINRNGRNIYITDHQPSYFSLADQGKIVFNSREIAVVQSMGINQEAAGIFLDVKEVFPGARVMTTESLKEKAA